MDTHVASGTLSTSRYAAQVTHMTGPDDMDGFFAHLADRLFQLLGEIPLLYNVAMK